MEAVNIDHIVVTVKDIDTTVQFYESMLSMKKENFGDHRVALSFGDQKINLHECGNEFEPKANTPMPGSEDLCFVTTTSLQKAIEHVKSKGVSILEGPVARTGAVGPMMSFYFRDPDGNLIEVASYENHTSRTTRS